MKKIKQYIKQKLPFVAPQYRIIRNYLKNTLIYRFFHILNLHRENRYPFFSSPTFYEEEAANGLKKEIKDLTPLGLRSNDSAESFWTEGRHQLRKSITNEDPRSFLTWKILRETIFGDGFGWQEEWEALDERLKKAAYETSIGLPIRFRFDKRTSAPMVRHAYHIKQFEEKTGTQVESMNLIVEFGGGYGGMCRLMHNLGFKGLYIIYDFPELNAIQRYFLKLHKIKIIEKEEWITAKSGVILISDDNLLNKLNNIELKKSLLLATWSISETPLETRNNFLDIPIIKGISNFIITYQENFFEKNNHELFEETISNFPGIKWEKNEIIHFPKNFYLIGSSSRK
jgi:hypothetical protein